MMDKEHDSAPGWCVIGFKGERHILPEDEVEQHHPQDCSCGPTLDDDDPSVVIHNSLDGRELYERGERRPS